MFQTKVGLHKKTLDSKNNLNIYFKTDPQIGFNISLYIPLYILRVYPIYWYNTGLDNKKFLATLKIINVVRVLT